MYLTKFKDLGIKQGHQYYQTENGIIWCDPIDQSNMIGGGHEEGRNTIHNPIRLQRIKALYSPNINILDFGCGNGLFVDYMSVHGYKIQGYDKFNPTFDEYPPISHYDLVMLTEVIEHLTDPFNELDAIFNFLKSGGQLMLETSFSNWLTMEDNYINPEAGHNTVWSHEGLTEVMLSKGFKEGVHIDRNVRIYIKP